MRSSGFGLFGSGIRTNILLVIALLEETHAQELSRILGVGKTTARNALDTLEQAGVIAGVLEWRARRVRLDPRFMAHDELSALLNKMALGSPSVIGAVAELKKRPRRSGKKL